MRIYTYWEARRNLSEVLDQAEAMGKVIVRRKDGRTLALMPEPLGGSPLDVPTIKTTATTQELVDLVRKERGRLRGLKKA